jgi:hypothetical protein
VELPLFDPNKPEYSLDSHLNKWLYFLKHSSDFERIPDMFKNDKVFQKAFWIAELANLTDEERRLYNLSLKRTWDTYAAWETSRNEGLAQGRSEGLAEGRIEGKIEGKIEALLLLFSQKLGPVPNDVEAMIRAINAQERIQAILSRFMDFNDWGSLKSHLTGGDK